MARVACVPPTRPRFWPPTAAQAVGALAALGAVGALIMAVSHAGVTVPLVAQLGPGGDRALPAVAGGFAVGAALFALVAAGARRQRQWAWALGLVINGITLIATTVPWRGPVSGAAAAVTVAGLAVLLSRPGRAAFLSDQPARSSRPEAGPPPPGP